VEVQSILLEEVKQKQWINMERFMEVALYHPTYGYYMNRVKKIGKEGDFYTSSSVSDVFGSVWANIFDKAIKEHHLDPLVVEFGGGNGNFAQQVLNEWEKQNKDKDITYLIIEKSPYHYEILRDRLNGLQVEIYRSFSELKKAYPAFKGIIFANEVLDAFPIRIFQKKKEWHEKVVRADENSDGFTYHLIPVEDHSLVKFLDKRFKLRKAGFDVEVSFQMENWLKGIYDWAGNGAVLFFVDYGYKIEQWQQEEMKNGSVRGYYQHQMINNPLLHAGKMDITYHVDWDYVIECGKEKSIETTSYLNQGDFLLREGLLHYLTNTMNRDPFSEEHKRNRAIRSFLLDNSLSGGFQVIQQKKRSD
jgi:SAM-dependent MidA family methyltransferase